MTLAIVIVAALIAIVAIVVMIRDGRTAVELERGRRRLEAMDEHEAAANLRPERRIEAAPQRPPV